MPPKNAINIEIRQLVQEHLSQIHAAARRVLGAHYTSFMDDLCQEVAIAVWQTLEKGEPIRTWKGFIYHCAHMRALDLLRQVRRRAQHEIPLTDLVDESEQTVEERLTNMMMGIDRLDEDLEALEEELARLPERNRMTVLLRLGEGYSRTEVARMLHCSEATVDYRLRQGVQQLRKRLR